MRTFIAIEIPGEIKQEIGVLQSKLKQSGVNASWTRLENIHLTLKFLGEVEESIIPKVMAALTMAAKNKKGFRINVAGAGAFPNPKHARVIWVGISGETEKLTSLQATIEDEAAALGFKRQDRIFIPHLTLGRIKYIRSSETWLKALDEIKNIKLAAFAVHTVNLMKSDLKPTGVMYTEINKVEM